MMARGAFDPRGFDSSSAKGPSMGWWRRTQLSARVPPPRSDHEESPRAVVANPDGDTIEQNGRAELAVASRQLSARFHREALWSHYPLEMALKNG